MTVTILIGNTDNKLKQAEWSCFCDEIRDYCRARSFKIHFIGYSAGNQPWQNACYVVEVPTPAELQALKDYLSRAAAAYYQDSIALISGFTDFIRP